MNQTFALTAQQKAFIDTFGYLALPGLLDDCIDEIIAEFEALWASRGGGHNGRPHDGEARSCIVPFIDQREKLCALLDDPRIVGLASGILGEDFNYMGSDGNYYAGDTRWHSDGWHKQLRHLKIAFYLDPLTRDTGCLRVIPGSHKLKDDYANSLQEHLGDSDGQWGVDGNQVPAVALETRPGDVVCFIHNTKHAAFGGGHRRRMFTINLSQRYPEDKLPDLRDYLKGFARFWTDRAYGETMIRTAGPRRMRHLEQVMANDGHLASLAEEARQTMAEPSRG